MIRIICNVQLISKLHIKEVGGTTCQARSQHRLWNTRLRIRTSSDSHQYSFFPRVIKDWDELYSRHYRAAHLGAVQGGHQMQVVIQCHVFTLTFCFCIFLATNEYTSCPPLSAAPPALSRC